MLSRYALPLRADGVDFVDEDNGGRVLFRHAKQLANEFRAVAEVLLYELRTHDP